MGLKFLPSSKAALIRNIYPLLVTIAGYYFLSEKLTRYDVIATVGAFTGVIIMNLNATDSSSANITAGHTMLGIFLCSTTATVSVGVALYIRLMNKYCHYLLNSTYFSYTLLLFSIFLLVFFPNVYHFEYYTKTDMVLFGLSGCAHYIAQNTQSLAYKYAEASKITPVVYTIGILLVLVDVFVFDYKFSVTDITGIATVIIFLAIPITVKFFKARSDSKSK